VTAEPHLGFDRAAYGLASRTGGGSLHSDLANLFNGLYATTQPDGSFQEIMQPECVREALRAFLLANARLPLAPEAAEAFDDAAGPAHLRARADERSRLELLPAEEGGLDHAIGRLVAIVFAAQQDGTWFRLKVCAECHWALYDHTKNHSAAWCGSKCGARVRSRRYRQRHGSPA
jgi:predicted RNA-binding Zn ribbon-like protein